MAASVGANFLKGKIMNVESVKNLQWSNAEHTTIDAIVKFGHFTEEVPFTANQNDVAEHGRALFTAIQAGQFGDIAAYIPPPEPVVISIEQQPTVDGAQTL